MKKRLFYGSGLVALAILIGLVVWQGSFNLGAYGPEDPTQTFIFWAVSTLIFILMVTLGFILTRTMVKLYIENRKGREGSRIKTKLVAGALALSFIPVLFLVLFSYEVLNINLKVWFSRPADNQRLNLLEISNTLIKEQRSKAALMAELLAAQPETARLVREGASATGFLNRFCKEHGLEAAKILRITNEVPLATCGEASLFQSQDDSIVMAAAPVKSGDTIPGNAWVASRVPLDLLTKQQLIEQSVQQYQKLGADRRYFRKVYLQLLTLIALFILFVATWMARFMANQISTPISALLRAAGEVRKGNLSYRVEIRALDELAVLVRAFNEMTRELEANSRELDARRRFTEAVLESIPTGVISVSADGSIQTVNRALKGIFPEDLARRAVKLEDLFSREDTAEIRYLMKRARRTGIAGRQMDLQTSRQTFHLAITVAALEEKLTSGFVVVLEDTSDLLRAQKAAAWNEVARRVAHELKNPLTPIALSAERIARQLHKLPAPPETEHILRECTEIISREVETVKSLVDEFSHFSRFPAAQPVRCDLNEVVESALAVFAGRLDGIEIRTQLARGLPLVNIDREQFKRVVVNLVDNAAEAMQESLVKQLYIATQAGAPDTIELVVADTGCGVTAEDKEKLFLPYFSTKGRGTGLGLAIVNHILSDHHAQIRIEDNEPVGARFIIEIPVAVEGSENGRAGESALAHSASRV